MIVLGVPVSADLQNSWRNWLAPDVQPFFVDSVRRWPKSTVRTTCISPELGHTYKVWKVDRTLETLWLDEATLLGMTLAHLNNAEASADKSPRVPLLMAIRDKLAEALREES